ncbi:MAG: Enoyl-CoA hydratase [Paucimonas sp.]|nr:Enoyl-CoA hydratase [Paucimonas sp.]
MSIAVSKQGGIASIGFDRIEKKNAITSAMYQQMTDAVLDAGRDPAIRVLFFHGAPEVFTSGNDLDDFLRNPPKGMDSPVFQFIHALSQAEKPVVAAVAGAAIGIGTTMLLHCDVVYAAENAKFSLPFAQLGLCPEFASSALLPAMVGYHVAAEKLLFGEPFLAPEALQMGLVNKLLPAAELDAYARARAATLAALPASSLRVTKSLMKAQARPMVAEAIAAEGRHFGAMLLAPEAKEAFTAFFEKRRPDFSKFS